LLASKERIGNGRENTTRASKYFFVAAGGAGKSVEATMRAIGTSRKIRQINQRKWLARHHESQLAENLDYTQTPHQTV
jgi:hypothetical protein